VYKQTSRSRFSSSFFWRATPDECAIFPINKRERKQSLLLTPQHPTWDWNGIGMGMVWYVDGDGMKWHLHNGYVADMRDMLEPSLIWECLIRGANTDDMNELCGWCRVAGNGDGVGGEMFGAWVATHILYKDGSVSTCV